MAEISDITAQPQTADSDIEDGGYDGDSRSSDLPGPLLSVSFVQKVMVIVTC